MNVPIWKIYKIKYENNLQNPTNPIFTFDDLQNQILLSGILGDGNFKSNGQHGYYYRESHAKGELEYLQWKANILNNLLTKSGIHEINGKGFNKQPIYEFMTRTSVSFANYANMKIENVINNLNEKGLILFYLDDGWLNKKTINISGGTLTDEQKCLIIDKFKQYNCCSIHLTKRKDFTFSVKDYQRLKNIALSFLPNDLDIMLKKFKY